MPVLNARLRAFYENALQWSVDALPDSIEVPDVEEALARVWDFGGTVRMGPCAGPWGGRPMGFFHDPSGRLVRLIEARPR